jgi:hypothetical protein
MKIAFTICSNNYLSLARVLGKSLTRHNPEYKFIIGLVDKKEPSISKYYNDFEVIPCDEIGLKELDEMANKYSIAEFNTAVKPSYFLYLFKRFPEAQQIVFVDPDMKVYDSLKELHDRHANYDILMTPHISQPIPVDGKEPSEVAYLATGTYNLGFLSVKRSAETTRFMEWWKDRLKDFCYFQFEKGLFVDQKWANLVPVFFDSVFIVKHPGYNIAYWNLQERNITRNNSGEIRVNGNYPLVIYHYSSVGIKQGKLFYKQQNRFQDSDFPLVGELYAEYVKEVKEEGYMETNPLPCYYVLLHEQHEKKRLKGSFAGWVKLAFKTMVPATTRRKWKRKMADALNT